MRRSPISSSPMRGFSHHLAVSVSLRRGRPRRSHATPYSRTCAPFHDRNSPIHPIQEIPVLTVRVEFRVSYRRCEVVGEAQ